MAADNDTTAGEGDSAEETADVKAEDKAAPKAKDDDGDGDADDVKAKPAAPAVTPKAAGESKAKDDDEGDDDADDADDVKAKSTAPAVKPKASGEPKAKAAAAKAAAAKAIVDPRAKWILFLIVAVASLVADQATKIWAKHALETRRNPSQDLEYTKELEKRIDPNTPPEQRRAALEKVPCDIPEDVIVRSVPNLPAGQPKRYWAPCSGVPSPVITNYWDWELSMNPGSAFGLFSGQGFARVFLSIVGLAAVGGMLWMLKKSRADQKILHWALAFVAGGAVGNLIDRIVDGVVTDFILWHYHDKRWPVFNVADIVLVVGVGLMFIDIQKEGKREKEKKKRRAARAKAAGLVKKLSDD
ncbi:MAG: signal peptidase II [Deltaproteobacteria bacterium]|nr:signal peptidase II [Deltaproteobacteria bacterium]